MGDERQAGSSAEEIMSATYRALSETGFAALTMQDIADECGKSKSLLHYHYDTKEELLTTFINHIIDEFERRVETNVDAPADERLGEFLDQFVFECGDEEREAFHVALLELRSQAPYNERYRDALRRSDDLLRSTAAGILRDGIEEGTFRDVDVEQTAVLIVAAMDGARTRQITLVDDGYARTVRDALDERVVEPLLIDAASDGETPE